MMRLEMRASKLGRQARPVGRHAVDAVDGADGDDVLVGALVAHHADASAPAAARRRPARACSYQPARADLLVDDRVGRLQDARRAPPSTSPRMRIARPGPGNGWRPTIVGGNAEHRAELAHLVLEQLAQRLDELELHPLGQPADVVVALDRRRRALEGDRLDDVRIERALRQELDVADSWRASSSKTSMKVSPMIRRLRSGSVDAGQARRGSARPRRPPRCGSERRRAGSPSPASPRRGAAGRCRRRCR